MVARDDYSEARFGPVRPVCLVRISVGGSRVVERPSRFVPHDAPHDGCKMALLELKARLRQSHVSRSWRRHGCTPGLRRVTVG